MSCFPNNTQHCYTNQFLFSYNVDCITSICSVSVCILVSSPLPLQNHRLDAIYYYMRSLLAKNPFKSAHDSLVGLFEDTSVKVRQSIPTNHIESYPRVNKKFYFSFLFSQGQKAGGGGAQVKGQSQESSCQEATKMQTQSEVSSQ